MKQTGDFVESDPQFRSVCRRTTCVRSRAVEIYSDRSLETARKLLLSFFESTWSTAWSSAYGCNSNLRVVLRLCSRTGVVMPAVGIPEAAREQQDKHENDNGVVHLSPKISTNGSQRSLLGRTKKSTHISSCNWDFGRQKENDRYESVPDDGRQIGREAPSAQVPRPPLEPAVHHLADEGQHIRHVEGHCADVKYGADGRLADETKQVDGDHEPGIYPNGSDRGTGAGPNTAQDAR